MIRIVIAEDHQSLIDGIKLLLENQDWIEVVGQANDGYELVKEVFIHKPDIVLTDIRMPKTDGISATKQIKAMYPDCKVIGFSMFDQEEVIFQMKEAGASGYLMKNASLKALLEAIKAVAEGEEYFLNLPEKTTNEKAIHLSPREKEILNLIGMGKSSKEIADELVLSEMTVATHRKNISRKLNLEGKVDLIRYATENRFEV
ncbi:MAG: response regulator transcription factor [Flavobacteriaceae bacterium]